MMMEWLDVLLRAAATISQEWLAADEAKRAEIEKRAHEAVDHLLQIKDLRAKEHDEMMAARMKELEGK